MVYEIHRNEQYLFDETTLAHLVSFVSRFDTPCCLSAPLLGPRLAGAGANVRILDIDERFAGVKGFRRWDVHGPEWTSEEYDLILCDPPFFNLSLSRLFAAIRVLARNDFSQPLLVSYLSRRASSLLGTFAKFDLSPTVLFPSYQTVQPQERNNVESAED